MKQEKKNRNSSTKKDQRGLKYSTSSTPIAEKNNLEGTKITLQADSKTHKNNRTK
jgi:hypothetical protein